MATHGVGRVKLGVLVLADAINGNIVAVVVVRPKVDFEFK